MDPSHGLKFVNLRLQLPFTKITIPYNTPNRWDSIPGLLFSSRRVSFCLFVRQLQTKPSKIARSIRLGSFVPKMAVRCPVNGHTLWLCWWEQASTVRLYALWFWVKAGHPKEIMKLRYFDLEMNTPRMANFTNCALTRLSHSSYSPILLKPISHSLQLNHWGGAHATSQAHGGHAQPSQGWVTGRSQKKIILASPQGGL